MCRGDSLDQRLEKMELSSAASLFVYAPDETLITSIDYPGRPEAFAALRPYERSTMISDALDSIWMTVARLMGQEVRKPVVETDNALLVSDLVRTALLSGTQVRTSEDLHGSTIFTVATPVMQNGRPQAVVAMASAAGEIAASCALSGSKSCKCSLSPFWCPSG